MVNGDTVYYAGDPQQRPLTFLRAVENGSCLIEWPKGQGVGKADLPWRHWCGQIRKEPWY